MTIQRVNLGTAPSGAGGDSDRSAFNKLDANFGDWNNAASRLVGKGQGNAMETGAFGLGTDVVPSIIANSIGELNIALNNQTQFFRNNGTTAETWQYAAGLYIKTGDTAMGLTSDFQGRGVRVFSYNPSNAGTPFIYDLYHKKSAEIYNTTTASSPNVFVTSSGELQRSTSSERYKKDIEHIELTDQQYAAIRQVKPIAYKSTTEADNPNHTFQSFSAEELAKASPTLVLWEYDETVIDESTGLPITRKLPERRPAGLNLNGLVALQHAFSLKQADLIDKQAKLIKDLTKRLEALENAGK